MNDFWEVIADIALELHPDRVISIANRISTLSSVTEYDKTRLEAGSASEKSLLNGLGVAWHGVPEISPQELSAALRGASETAHQLDKREVVEMVWTGPSSGLVPSRHTEQALLEVIESAKEKLFIVSFVAYNIRTIRDALTETLMRKVKLDILLESPKSRGGKIDIDSAKAFEKALPTANIYAWSRESALSDPIGGVVHAKCAVSDGKLAFITSANLTSAAMERNMEMGVLIRGGRIPDNLHRHLEALVTTRIIKRI